MQVVVALKELGVAGCLVAELSISVAVLKVSGMVSVQEVVHAGRTVCCQGRAVCQITHAAKQQAAASQGPPAATINLPVWGTKSPPHAVVCHVLAPQSKKFALGCGR